MICPVPRRDLIKAAKDMSCPAQLSDNSVHGTPHQPPPRPKTRANRLNQLEKSCIIGVPAGIEIEEEEDNRVNEVEDLNEGKPIWMGSGYMRRAQGEKNDIPRLGDGTGNGHEERSPLQPYFFNVDSELLERL